MENFSIGEFALESHLDRGGVFLEVVEREAGEKRVGRKAIRVDHPPRCMAEMAIHRSKDRVDLCTGLRRDIVRMVRIPYVGCAGSVTI